MEVLIKTWQSSLYAWPAAFFVTVFFIILFFLPANRSRNIPLSIKLYLIAYGITFIVIDAAVLIRNQTDYFTYQLRHYTDYTFTITEFILLIYYFYTHNNNSGQKKIFFYLAALFLITAIVLSAQLPSGLAVVRLYTTQVFLLLIPCFFYFRNLFKNTAVIDISNEPTFWISTGITFFLVCTMILSVIESFFLFQKPHILAKLYPIYYVFYILMFFMFFRAYLCKTFTIKT